MDGGGQASGPTGQATDFLIGKAATGGVARSAAQRSYLG
jgi:hypothetical protein